MKCASARAQTTDCPRARGREVGTGEPARVSFRSTTPSAVPPPRRPSRVEYRIHPPRNELLPHQHDPPAVRAEEPAHRALPLHLVVPGALVQRRRRGVVRSDVQPHVRAAHLHDEIVARAEKRPGEALPSVRRVHGHVAEVGRVRRDGQRPGAGVGSRAAVRGVAARARGERQRRDRHGRRGRAGGRVAVLLAARVVVVVVVAEHGDQADLLRVRLELIEEVLGHARARALVRGPLERAGHDLRERSHVRRAHRSHGRDVVVRERQPRALERGLREEEVVPTLDGADGVGERAEARRAPSRSEARRVLVGAA
eukprot:30871-Pelagococcus_subviridis.AAC.1